jgi:hypothetical protein
MRPETQDTPPSLPQSAVRGAVAGDIAQNFWVPVILIGVRQVAVPWAAMPKATVNKNSETLAVENEVGMAWDLLVTSPAFNAVATQDGRQPHLCALISAGADSSHDLGSFLCREHVGHASKHTGIFMACARHATAIGSGGLQNANRPRPTFHQLFNCWDFVSHPASDRSAPADPEARRAQSPHVIFI